MSDLAKLGFLVNTKGLKSGEQALDNFASKGEATEKRVNKSAKRISAKYEMLKSVIGKTSLEFLELSNRSGKAGSEVSKDITKMRNSINSLNKELKKSGTSFGRFSSSSKTASVNTTRNLRTIKEEAFSLNKALGVVLTGIVAIGGVQLTKDLITYSDAWKNVNSQLRQVTKSESELINIRTKLLTLTKDTRSDLEGTVNLFAEMTRGTKELNISSDRLLGVTKTLNNLFVAGGKPISEVTGAIRQLNQGFASGVLRGDEFNSVAEGAPKIMDALSVSLNKTRGELREFAATGGITAQILVSALEDYEKTAQKLADQTEKTFGQNIKNATTNTIEFVGNAKALNIVIGGLGETIESFSENLNATTAAAEAALTVIGIGLTPVMFGYVKSLVAVAAAQLTVGTTAIKTVSALGVVSTATATATITTNALGIATRFLLGPWGLLIAAIGTAAAVFVSTKDNTSELTKEVKKLNDETLKAVNIYDAYVARLKESNKTALSGIGQSVLQDQLDKSTKLVELYTDRLKKLNEQNASALRVNALLLKIEQEKETLEEINKLLPNAKTSYEKMSGAVKKLVDNLEPSSAALRKFEGQQKLLSNAQKEGIISTGELIKFNDLLQESYAKSNENIDVNKTALMEQVEAIKLQSIELAIGADAFELYTIKANLIATGAAPAVVKAMLEIVKANKKVTKDLDLKKQFNLKDLQDDVANFGGAWSKTGSVIVDAFGDMSDALSNYLDSLDELKKLDKGISIAREKHGKDSVQVIKLEKDQNENRVMAELSGLKAISSASASLFAEKTFASKTFAALNKIITIAEIALSFEKMTASTVETVVVVGNETVKQGAKAKTAIASAFGAPFPIGFLAGAAMIGIMASLLGGAFGGGGVTDPTKGRQETQGTGTVFGSSEKSQSILKSQERFVDINIDQLAELRGIRNSINSLSLGIAKLVGTVISADIGKFEGDLSGGGISEKLKVPELLGFGTTFNAVVGSLFGKTTKKVIDQGIVFVAQTLGGIIEGGILDAQAFFDVKVTKKKLFGLSKSVKVKTEFQDIDIAIKEQMANIFGFIGDTVLQSAQSLGFETVTIIKETSLGFVKGKGGFLAGIFNGAFESVFSEVELSLEDALSQFVVDIGKISTEGLEGEELEKEFQSIISTQSDLIAEFLVPAIAEHAKLGEGLFDTLTRVAKEQAFFNDAMDVMGFNLSELSNVLEIDIGQSLIDLTGGFEKFTDLTGSFVDDFFTDAEKFEFLQSSLRDVFDSLELPLETTRDGFKDLIRGIDLTTQSGQELLSSLLMISPALSEFIEELERVESERVSFGIDLLRLTGKAEEALAIEREIQLEGMDDSLKSLQSLIFAEQDRLSLLQQQEDAARTSFSMLEKSIDLEKQRVQAIFDAAQTAHDVEIERINLLRTGLEAENELRKQNLSNAESVLSASFKEEINRIQENASARIKGLNDERSAINSTASSMRSLVSNINKSLGLSGGLDLISALSSARSGSFTQAQNLNIGALTKLDPRGFGSAEDLAVQQAINQNRLAEIGMLAGNQLTQAELMIKSIDDQILLTKQIADDDVKLLQDQMNLLLGIDNSILGVGDAIDLFKKAQQELEALNFDKEIAKLDMLIESADEVFNLHQTSYDEEFERLDLIIESNLELLNSSLNINTSVLTIPQAIFSLQQAVNNIPVAIAQSNASEDKKENEELTNEIKMLRKEAFSFQMEVVKNTKSSANSLENMETGGIDTRVIT